MLNHHLKAWLPGVDQCVYDAIGEAGNSQFGCWAFIGVWEVLEPHAKAIEAVLWSYRTAEELRQSAIELHQQLGWRQLREVRLTHVDQPDYSRNRDFVEWLLSQPMEAVTEWARYYVPEGARCISRRDAAFRLSRLRPMPLEILWLFHVFSQSGTIARLAALSDRELCLHYVALAAMQWLEWSRCRRNRYYRPPNRKRTVHDGNARAMMEVCVAAQARLTVREELFEAMRAIGLAAFEGKALPALAGLVPAVPASDTPTLHLVKTRCRGPSGAIYRGDSCRSCKAHSVELGTQKRLPPYRIGCTCELMLDWESEPLAEAPFEWVLERWVQSVGRFSYGFPGRRILFKLHEQDLATRARQIAGDRTP